MPTKCDASCIDPLWCIERNLCKRDEQPQPVERDQIEAPDVRWLRGKPTSPLDEIAVLVRGANETHSALSRLFVSCAPQCIPGDNTIDLINQLSNVIAGYKAEQAKLAEALIRISRAAEIYETQSGSGLLVKDIRNGFEKIRETARQAAWAYLK